jgi:RimJ/RimL family protein N-acetyltransferase
VTTSLHLVPFSADLALDVIAGNRHDNWAPGYPTEGDHEVAGRIADGAWQSPSETKPWGAWAVVVDGTLVGGAGFHSTPDDEGTAEIGYGIAPDWQGRGIATAAVLALVAMARAHGAQRLVAGTDRDNIASQRCSNTADSPAMTSSTINCDGH